MFNLSNNDNISMGLRKMTTDYISMGDEGHAYETKEDLFRFNTSGHNSGIRRRIENAINKQVALMSKKKIRIHPNDVYERLLKKAENAASDYDYNIGLTLTAYCLKLLSYVFEDIYKEIKNGSGDDVSDKFTSESDLNGSEESETSTEMLMYKEGRFDGIDIDEELSKDSDYWRETFVESLFLILSLQREFFETDQSKLNLIRLVQANYANMRDIEERKYVESLIGGKKSSHRSKAKEKGKLASSLGLNYNSSILGKLRTVLPEDYNGSRRIFNAFEKFISACSHLNLPIEFLDEVALTDEEYLNKLYVALKNRKTVSISEYDVLEFDSMISLIEVRKTYARDGLLKMGVDPKSINKVYTDNLNQAVTKMRASDFHSLDNALRESRDLYVSMKQKKHEKTMAKKSVKTLHKTVGQIAEETWEGSEKHLQLLKLINHDIVVHGYTKENGRQNMFKQKGTLSPESIDVVMRAINGFKRDLTLSPGKRIRQVRKSDGTTVKIPLDTSHLQGLRAIVRESIIRVSTRPLERDGFGFLRYADNKHYVQHREAEPFAITGSADNKFEFRNFLVHEDGFLVSKFLDGKIIGNRDYKIYSACNKDSFENLIIKTVARDLILEGLE